MMCKTPKPETETEVNEEDKPYNGSTDSGLLEDEHPGVSPRIGPIENDMTLSFKLDQQDREDDRLGHTPRPDYVPPSASSGL